MRFVEIPKGDVCLVYRDGNKFRPVLLDEGKHKLLQMLVSSIAGEDPLVINRKQLLEVKDDVET